MYLIKKDTWEYIGGNKTDSVKDIKALSYIDKGLSETIFNVLRDDLSREKEAWTVLGEKLLLQRNWLKFAIQTVYIYV